MISVQEALAALFDLVTPLPTEHIPLSKAAGRVLREPVSASRNQPPFDASAMDGYAVRAAEIRPDARWTIVGESAAGHRFEGDLPPNAAVRIFTGAPLPDSADHVIIQENVSVEGSTLVLVDGENTSSFVRKAGNDFSIGDQIKAPRLLKPADIALLASMNQAKVTVSAAPKVAIIPTGDELVQPGETPGDDQIIASNSFGLAAMLQSVGADVRLLPIARDRVASLKMAFTLAADADLVVTIGGASVGDHDLVASAAAEMGLDQKFYKVAMRPGKPLMAGHLGQAILVGLPGNPVSAMVCGEVFLKPMMVALQGLPSKARETFAAPLAHDLWSNGPREHYMRARLEDGKITVFERQDSGLLSILNTANALVVRAPKAPTATAGTLVNFIPI